MNKLSFVKDRFARYKIRIAGYKQDYIMYIIRDKKKVRTVR